jgi:hypothetical protein
MDLRGWKRDYWLWLPLALAAWRNAWKYRDAFISDWDGFDYTALVVQGLPSPLGLGRALFLGYNRLLWLAAHHWFNLPAEQAYLLIRYGVFVLAGVAAAGLYALYKELTASRVAAVCGALLVVFSPFFITYSGRGMSEIPGLAALGWSLWWMLRSLRLGRRRGFAVGALLFGLSANVREFAVFYLPLVPLLAWVYRRELGAGVKWVAGVSLGSGVAALAGPIFWALYLPSYYLPAVKGWYKLSAEEREVYPVTARNWEFLVSFAYEASAAAALLGALALGYLVWRVWRGREWRLPPPSLLPLLAVGALGWLAALVLVENHDLAVNPRYLLTGLVGVAATCGWLVGELFRRRSLWTAAVLVLLLKGVSDDGLREMRKKAGWARAGAAEARAYLMKLDGLERDAVFIVGGRTPLVNFYRSIGARPGWQTVAPGSAWPDERLGSVVDEYLAAGRPVYVDFDEDLWNPGSRERSREGPGLQMVRDAYQLEAVRDTLYRVARRKTAGKAEGGG